MGNIGSTDCAVQTALVKFIYSDKAAKFCEVSTLLLTVCTVVKSKMEILQNIVAFSEYMNFTNLTTYRVSQQIW